LVPPARIDLFQQPVGDDIPGVLIVVPVPESAIGLEIPGVVDPTQGEVELSVGAGPGAGSIGLMPALPSSVAPSGTVPIPSVDPAVVPEVNGFCVPDTVAPDGTELHAPDMPALPPPNCPDMPTLPPPSKVELDPAVPEPPIPGVALPVTDVPFVPQREVPAVEPNGPGLRPPGSSSVEPKGMPTWPTDPAPSGDVVPIPGEPAGPIGATCDMAGAPPRKSIAAEIGSRHLIEVSIMCASPTFGHDPTHRPGCTLPAALAAGAEAGSRRGERDVVATHVASAAFGARSKLRPLSLAC
jgi:hypothetical protein